MSSRYTLLITNNIGRRVAPQYRDQARATGGEVQEDVGNNDQSVTFPWPGIDEADVQSLYGSRFHPRSFCTIVSLQSTFSDLDGADELEYLYTNLLFPYVSPIQSLLVLC